VHPGEQICLGKCNIKLTGRRKLPKVLGAQSGLHKVTATMADGTCSRGTKEKSPIEGDVSAGVIGRGEGFIRKCAGDDTNQVVCGPGRISSWNESL